MTKLFIEVWVLHEVFLLPDEWLHLPLLSLNDLGHGLVEEVAGGVHSSLSIVLWIEGSISSSATGNRPRCTNCRILEVGNPLVRTLIGFSHMGLHLNLECPSSGNSPWVSLTIFNHRILNYKIIVELLRD